ncbi:MAG: hypothetical protein AAFY71_02245 [Bacteroidota bacterium]
MPQQSTHYFSTLQLLFLVLLFLLSPTLSVAQESSFEIPTHIVLLVLVGPIVVFVLGSIVMNWFKKQNEEED